MSRKLSHMLSLCGGVVYISFADKLVVQATRLSSWNCLCFMVLVPFLIHKHLNLNLCRYSGAVV